MTMVGVLWQSSFKLILCLATDLPVAVAGASRRGVSNRGSVGSPSLSQVYRVLFCSISLGMLRWSVGIDCAVQHASEY